MIKTLSKIRIELKMFQVDKNTSKKNPTSNIIPNNEKLYALLLWSTMRQEYMYKHFYLSLYEKF